MLPSFEITDRWSGQVIETNDGLPYIGETAERQFVATGFAGNGMTFGTLAAMMARDAALGRVEPVERSAVGRPHASCARRLGLPEGEQGLPATTSFAIGSRRRKGASVRVLRRGEGKILNIDGQRVAAYRDARRDGHRALGHLHAHGL